MTPEKLAEVLARQLDGRVDYETSTWITANIDVNAEAAAIVIADPDVGPTSRFKLTIEEF